jgi:hypothetical protein
MCRSCTFYNLMIIKNFLPFRDDGGVRKQGRNGVVTEKLTVSQYQRLEMAGETWAFRPLKRHRVCG